MHGSGQYAGGEQYSLVDSGPYYVSSPLFKLSFLSGKVQIFLSDAIHQYIHHLKKKEIDMQFSWTHVLLTKQSPFSCPSRGSPLPPVSRSFAEHNAQ
jgi:hypothetical protein